MADGMGRGALVRSIGALFSQGPVSGLDDGELLDRFVARRDEAAFSALVTLHGPAVLGVCRRILRHPHDVEDAFQATFLVLVRRAGSIRDPRRLAPWLHGVARRVALRRRADAARRQAQVYRMESVASNQSIETEHAEIRGAIDEEVGRLPARYRDAVVLCDLEGRSYAEAARRLRCPLGTVQSRLARGRQRLRISLTRRGLAPAVGGVAVADWLGESASAAVSSMLREATVRGALATALGQSAMTGAVSATAAALTAAALRGMAVASLKTASAAVVLVASILLGGGLLARGISADPQVPADAEEPPVAAKKAPDKKAVPGGFSLSGIVLRPGGRPTPKATVIIQQRNIGDSTVRLETDKDGRFQSGPVFDPKQHEMVVTAIAPGLAWTETTTRVTQPMAPATIQLTPRQPLHGRVVDSKGKPVAGAAIEPTSEFRGGTFDWKAETDADGRFDWFEAPTLGTIVLNATKAPFTQALGRSFEAAGSREITITLHRPLHLHGTVTDAETGKPIERFSVISGWGPDEHRDQVEWLRNSALTRGGGRIEFRGGLFPDQGLRRSIRIEAEGHLPDELLGFRDDAEEIAHDFKLRPAKPLTGIVRGPDGKPLAGADVALSAEEERAQIKNGRLIKNLVVGGRTMTTTFPDGRYTFSPRAKKVGVVVVHDSGFGYSSPDALAKSTDITIAPWGRIEGTVRIGSKPAPRKKVAAWLINPWIYNRVDYDTTTDAQGRFTIERVVPYRVGVYRYVDIDEGMGWTPSNQVNVNVAPGETVARVEIGGTGRPVVGRLRIPAGASLADFVLGFGSLAVERAQMPYPDDYPDFTQDQQSAWYQTFQKSPAGQAYLEGERQYAVAMHSDGSFRIEDVPAGRYILKLPFKDRLGDEHPNRLAYAKSEVIVPEILGGRSDEPFDIGTIPLAVFPLNRLQVGDRVPSIPDKAADGRPLGLDAYRSKFVLLVFWSTREGSRADLASLQAVRDSFGRDPRLVMIGLNQDIDPEYARRYAARHGLAWEQRYLGSQYEPNPIPASLGVTYPPQILLIGPDGRLIAKDLHGDAIKQAVAEALKPKG